MRALTLLTSGLMVFIGVAIVVLGAILFLLGMAFAGDAASQVTTARLMIGVLSLLLGGAVRRIATELRPSVLDQLVAAISAASGASLQLSFPAMAVWPANTSSVGSGNAPATPKLVSWSMGV